MRRDNHLIEDIRLAAEQIAEFTSGMQLSDFLDDARTRSAVERQLIIMGEAANRLTPALRAAHPEVPWSRMVHIRNFYVHGYERLSIEEVWGTVRRLVPRVARLIAPLISQDDEQPE